jgi:hypothetical protein
MSKAFRSSGIKLPLTSNYGFHRVRPSILPESIFRFEEASWGASTTGMGAQPPGSPALVNVRYEDRLTSPPVPVLSRIRLPDWTAVSTGERRMNPKTAPATHSRLGRHVTEPSPVQVWESPKCTRYLLAVGCPAGKKCPCPRGPLDRDGPIPSRRRLRRHRLRRTQGGIDPEPLSNRNRVTSRPPGARAERWRQESLKSWTGHKWTSRKPP